MKRFSNINSNKIDEELKTNPNKGVEELNNLKLNIINLMDKCLTIRSNGSAHRDLLNNSVDISGKEMFVNELIDMISGDSLKEQSNLLESLKYVIRDWNLIDEQVKFLNLKIDDINFIKANINHVKKIKSFMELYDSNVDFDSILENHVSRINSADTAYLRHSISLKMLNDIKYYKFSKKNLLNLSNRFLEKYKELNTNDAG